MFERSKKVSKVMVHLKKMLFQFDLLSTPWIEDSSPLTETLQTMVSMMNLKKEMAGPTADVQRNLSLDERLEKVKKPLNDKVK